MSRRLNETGTVGLEVQVSASGQPESVRVRRSSGYERLDQAAVETVRKSYRFKPAMRDGQAVAGTVTFNIVFDFKDSED